MKLYLSSYRIPTPDDLFALIGKKPSQTRVAIIPNAKDYYAPRAKNFKMNEVATYFETLGARTEVVDLLEHEGSLPEVLAPFDALHI